MWSGTILDTYPDYHRNRMITWLTGHGKTTRIETPYTPSFYVAASPSELTRIATTLRDLPDINNIALVTKKTQLGSNQKQPVLQVTPKKLQTLTKLATIIDSWGKFHRYQLFNVDLRIPTRYLHDHGIFCNAYVHWNGTRFILDDTPWALDYPLPQLTTCHLQITWHKKGLVNTYNDPIETIHLNDTIIHEENETDTILTMVHHLKKLDPDIIYTNGGDTYLFPYLSYRVHSCGITNHVNLGRDPYLGTTSLQPAKDSRSYFSYGHIIHRPAFYLLKGRLHLDTTSSFLYHESGLHGLVDISRCANIPLQLLSRLGPGTAISQIQINHARTHHYLIPWKKRLPETWKTAAELLIADRGGLILDPIVGLHEHVIEFDYASLYPSIILRHNISPETLLCSCCTDSPYQVPQLGYHICTRQTGLIPQVLEPILFRRFCFKARAKNPHYNTQHYTELQQAWKWILLVCFGYTGYRNARYGRIECHESITAFSRDILLTAFNLAEHAGYHVLHGIIDSLWVKPSTEHPVHPRHLARIISKRTGIRLDVEGRYTWIVFLPSKTGGVGALTRYYGLFDTGVIKVRGIELRQHNTPTVLRNLQHDILAILAAAHTTESFMHHLPKTIAVLQSYGARIKNNQVPVHDLIFTTRISKPINDYTVNTLVKAALIQHQDAGIPRELGQTVRYLVCDENASDYKHRVRIPELLTDHQTIDKSYYLRQIAKCAESLLIPFGYTKEVLEQKLLA